MLSKKSKDIFQDYMPNNICFGCGNSTKNGLHIKSYWNGEIAECEWSPKNIHQGWRGILNGGIIATVIDCHVMGTSMAYAYKHEKRSLGSLPEYKYATGTMKIKYIKPTPNNTIQLKAKILSYSEKKVHVSCEVLSKGIVTAIGEVVAFRVYDSSKKEKNLFQID